MQIESSGALLVGTGKFGSNELMRDALIASGTEIVTVAMDGMSFLQPVRVGDRVACYAWVEKIGRTSMKIPVEVWVERYMTGEQVLVEQARALDRGA